MITAVLDRMVQDMIDAAIDQPEMVGYYISCIEVQMEEDMVDGILTLDDVIDIRSTISSCITCM